MAIAFLLFALFVAAMLQVTLVQPHARQAADDLAALLVLTAQIWVELPPTTRPDYQRELLRRHQLRIMATEAAHPTPSNTFSYLEFLEAALEKQLGSRIGVHSHPAHAGWLWADFPVGGRTIRLGFRADRLHNRLLLILPFLAAIGLFVAFVLSVTLVRRVARPLAQIADATRRIGFGDFSTALPETGPSEIADLARRINLMQRHIGRLLENRTTLLAGISHDLRTPLARMRIELELLQGNDDRALADGLAGDIAEMEHLIEQTLLLARGLGKEDAVATDIRQLVADVVENHAKTGGQLRLSADAPVHVVVRVNALRRVIGNLIENAIAYGGDAPVDVSVSAASGAVTIEVRDRGVGIPPAEHAAIFEPFHRLEASRNRATGGSGLGLAIVRQLCDANGWDVAVDSTVGSGTTFTVSLPRA